jgi:hypothetical protein
VTARSRDASRINTRSPQRRPKRKTKKILRVSPIRFDLVYVGDVIAVTRRVRVPDAARDARLIGPSRNGFSAPVTV